MIIKLIIMCMLLKLVQIIIKAKKQKNKKIKLEENIVIPDLIEKL